VPILGAQEDKTVNRGNRDGKMGETFNITGMNKYNLVWIPLLAFRLQLACPKRDHGFHPKFTHAGARTRFGEQDQILFQI
jgi:hypothetical protein